MIPLTSRPFRLTIILDQVPGMWAAPGQNVAKALPRVQLFWLAGILIERSNERCP